MAYQLPGEGYKKRPPFQAVGCRLMWRDPTGSQLDIFIYSSIIHCQVHAVKVDLKNFFDFFSLDLAVLVWIAIFPIRRCKASRVFGMF